MLKFNIDEIHYFLKEQYVGKRGIKSKNQDRMAACMGREGLGKSHFVLHLFTAWYDDILKKKIDGEYFCRQFVATNEGFVDAIKNSHKYDMLVHDEAILAAYSRESMSKMNVQINKTFMVIRGLNFYTVLNIPSVLDLDTNFRNRRLNVLFYIDDIGVCYMYGRKKLDDLIPAMQKAKLYSVNPNPLKMKDVSGVVIHPDARIDYPEYKGRFRKDYDAMKTKAMNTQRDSIEQASTTTKEDNKVVVKEFKDAMATIKAPKPIDPVAVAYYRAYQQIGSQRKTAQALGISTKKLTYRLDKLTEEQKSQIAAAPNKDPSIIK